MAPATANLVAERIISLSYEKHNPVSNLKLQKLLYYAQAWNLALNEHPLFEEEIQAWVHGPVVPEVFRRYRDCKWSPIPDSKDSSSYQFRAHLEEVWKVYGAFTAFDLERLTHSEDPWKIARAGLAPDASSNNIISKSSMRDYYSARLNGQS
jgi:uncharacterized phage-associated protein